MSDPAAAPGEPEIHVLAGAGDVSAAAADRIAAALAAAVAERGRADWATTGGSTPGPIYQLLAAPPLRHRVPWAGVELWWGDDRFVPRDHPHSNARIADQLLVADASNPAGVPIPAGNVHAVPTAEAIGAGRGPDWCAARYAAELRSSGIPTAGGWPAFDVVLVGIGPDGHLLSVFPGTDVTSSTEWALGVPAPTHVEPHVARITLHPAILDVARLVLVVAHGAGKADILGRVLDGPRDPVALPAQLARRAGAVWLLDAAAAAGLARAGTGASG